MEKVPTVKFYNGQEIPILGLGTWRAKPNEVTEAVKHAIDVGYRHIDGAFLYANEKEIGEALRTKIEEGVVKREDVFITSKLWNTFHRPGAVEPALRTTLTDLGVDYVDLYLIHWPMAYKEGSDLIPKDANGKVEFADYDFVDTWKAMEEICEKGLAKSIGVSNFNEAQLDRILKEGRIKPVTNQVECQPYLTQIELSEYCESKGVPITAFRPLGGERDRLPSDPKIINISMKYKKTAAQVLLRYQIQRGHIVIPKSVNKNRIEENFAIFDFELSSEDMELINSFNCNRRMTPMTENPNEVMVTPRNGGGDEDKISLITAASTCTPQESIDSSLTGISGIEARRRLGTKPHQRVGVGRTFSYRKKKPPGPDSLFAAPPGVNPHHMSSSSSRRNTGGSRLVFIWPQKTRTRGRMLSVMAPLMHGVVVALLFSDAVHLWPGEFLPNCIPSSTPPPQPPVQCNIIEPLWFDNT